MSNVLYRYQILHFQMPQSLVESGTLGKLSEAALKLYIALLYKAQHHTKTAFTLTQSDIRELTNLSPNSITAATRQLAKFGLLACRKGAGGVLTYTLCNPDNGDPLLTESAAAATQAGGQTVAKQARIASNVRIGMRSGRGSGRKDSASDVIHALTYEEKRRYFEARLDPARFRRVGSGVQAICPFHHDEDPSLSLNFDEGVWYCHGCHIGGGMVDFEKRLSGVTGRVALENIAQAIHRPDLRLTRPSKAHRVHSYSDANGRMLCQVLKYDDGTFRERRPNPNGRGWINEVKGVENVLYRLPEVLNALIVLVCEGEKDADNLRSALIEGGLWPEMVATTSRNGANAWQDELGDALAGKTIIILPDNDKPGREYAIQVADSAYRRGATVRIVYLVGLPEGGDVSDYLENHTMHDLVQEARKTPDWKPSGADSVLCGTQNLGNGAVTNCDTAS